MTDRDKYESNNSTNCRRIRSFQRNGRPCIEEQGSGTITARVMASNAYPALEEKVVLKVALNDGQDIQSVVWTMEGQTLGEEPELEYTFTKEGSYNISVRVTDKTGNVAAALQKLQVSGKSLRYALQHFDPVVVLSMVSSCINTITPSFVMRGSTSTISTAPPNSIQLSIPAIEFSGIFGLEELPRCPIIQTFAGSKCCKA